MLQATGCKNIDCLIALSGKQIAGKGSGSGPVIDQVSLTASPSDLISQGKHNKGASVILGSNRDEDASPWFSSTLPANMNELEFNVIVGAMHSGKLGEIKKLYDKSVYPYPKDLGHYSQWWWTATRVLTDAVPGLGACGTRWLAKLLVKGGSSNVYTYLFAHPEQFANPGIPGTGPGSVIVPHAAEIEYVFDATDLLTGSDELELGAKVSKYWVNFAVTGNPNDAQLPTWPKYSPDTDKELRIDAGPSGIGAERHLRKAQCDYWEENLGMFPTQFTPPTPTERTIVV